MFRTILLVLVVVLVLDLLRLACRSLASNLDSGHENENNDE